MSSQEINKNTTFQKNERETLIKKMVLKHLRDGFWTSLYADNRASAKYKNVKRNISLAGHFWNVPARNIRCQIKKD